MLSIPGDFFARLASDAWGEKPTVWRRPFAAELASGAEVFAALLELGRRLRAGDERIAFRFNRAGAPLEDGEARLPEVEDAGFAGYAERLRGRGGAEDAGIIVNSFQALHPEIWRRTLPFLTGLYREVGVPSGGALIDFFTGNYRRSFLDFHKDDQDVFTFVIEGHKRLLAWPFEVFRDVAGLSDEHRGRSFSLRGLDYRPHLERAVVLEGGPGDVFYWPASWWHIAEGDGSWPVTLTVAVIQRGDPAVKLALAGATAGGEGVALEPFCRDGHPLARHAGLLRGVLQAAPLQRALEEKALMHLTRSGYRLLPEPRPLTALGRRACLRRSHEAALAWFVRDGEVVWAACGQLGRARAGRGIEATLGALALGEVVPVGELASRWGRRGASQLKLLEELVRVRAVDVVEE